MLKTQSPKFVGKYRKTPDILDEWYGYQEFFSHSLALEMWTQYLHLQTVISQKKKKSLSAPFEWTFNDLPKV